MTGAATGAVPLAGLPAGPAAVWLPDPPDAPAAPAAGPPARPSDDEADEVGEGKGAKETEEAERTGQTERRTSRGPSARPSGPTTGPAPQTSGGPATSASEPDSGREAGSAAVWVPGGGDGAATAQAAGAAPTVTATQATETPVFDQVVESAAWAPGRVEDAPAGQVAGAPATAATSATTTPSSAQNAETMVIERVVESTTGTELLTDVRRLAPPSIPVAFQALQLPLPDAAPEIPAPRFYGDLFGETWPGVAGQIGAEVTRWGATRMAAIHHAPDRSADEDDIVPPAVRTAAYFGFGRTPLEWDGTWYVGGDPLPGRMSPAVVVFGLAQHVRDHPAAPP